MEGNIYRSAGVAIGILIGLVIAFALIIVANKNRKFKTEYDMFIVGIGGFSLPIDEYVLHFAGIILGVLVLSGICIWKDAYWGLNNNRKRYGIILVVAGLLNAFPVAAMLMGKSDDSFPWVNLLVCVMLLVVGVELIMKHLVEKRAERAED